MDWGRTDPQLDVYVPSAVSPSGGMSLAPPSRHQPIVRPVILAVADTQSGARDKTIGPERTTSEFDYRIYRFRLLDPSEKCPHIPDNAGVPLSLS